jgi:uncharacterized protein YdeI (YjbR/CyaY-like superfamily)
VSGVDEPVELQQALDRAPDARTTWEALAPSRRREHARYVAGANETETRRRRGAATIELLERA